MGALVTVRVNTDEVRRLGDPERLARANRESLQAGVNVFLPLAREEAPTRTGRARAGIVGNLVWSSGGVMGLVYPSSKQAWYLRILSSGARPHVIAPTRFRRRRHAKAAARALGPARARGALRALRIALGGGEYIFRASVQHPGIGANDFMARAARRGEGAYVAATERIIERALDVHHG